MAVNHPRTFSLSHMMGVRKAGKCGEFGDSDYVWEMVEGIWTKWLG
jgi:hypothetical protein